MVDLMKQYGSTCPRIIVFFRHIKQIAEVYENKFRRDAVRASR